jgi:hypothetical protein
MLKKDEELENENFKLIILKLRPYYQWQPTVPECGM